MNNQNPCGDMFVTSVGKALRPGSADFIQVLLNQPLDFSESFRLEPVVPMKLNPNNLPQDSHEPSDDIDHELLVVSATISHSRTDRIMRITRSSPASLEWRELGDDDDAPFSSENAVACASPAAGTRCSCAPRSGGSFQKSNASADKRRSAVDPRRPAGG
jgi:hypothetical protein